MTDRPILFSAPMVCALLEGRKTQTRRVMRHQPYLVDDVWWVDDVYSGSCHLDDLVNNRAGCMKYQVGDRLWVREAWRVTKSLDGVAPRDLDQTIIPEWIATDPVLYQGRKRASMHLPRRFSRLTLHVTDVRVQRLQDISEEDAWAEGCVKGKATGRVFDNMAALRLGCDEWRNSRDWFADLWDSINEALGLGWSANPWVVAVTFTIERGNIDGTRDASIIMLDSDGPSPSGRQKDRVKP